MDRERFMTEKRNWFYALLNLACLIFVMTALAYAIVPVLEEKAADAGQPAPPWRELAPRGGRGDWRSRLRQHGTGSLATTAPVGLTWPRRREYVPTR
jgi:hypothetical protein